MSVEKNILEVTRGEHVAAVATITEGRPAVRFMALEGLDDLSLIGSTMKSSRKVDQMRKIPNMLNIMWK